MSLGRFAGEVFGEVLFMKLLAGAWKWARDTFGEHIKDAAKKHVIDPRSWDDEVMFAIDLAQAEGNATKKRMIEQAMERVQGMDVLCRNNYARNFRIIVTCKDDPIKPIVSGIKNPGTIILEDLMNTCTNEHEVYLRMVAIGLLQDGNTNMEKFITFSKEAVWPYIKSKGQNMHHSADAAVTKLETVVIARNKRSILSKIFFN